MPARKISPQPFRYLLRLPRELHAALTAEAERQGVSLNTLIVTLLAGAIGWPAKPSRRR